MIKIKLDMKIINGFYTKKIPCIGEYYVSPGGKIFNGENGKRVAANLSGPKRCQYLRFNVYEPGSHKLITVHRAVFEAWKGPIPSDMVVDHANRDRLNNHSSNLRLATRSQNCKNNNSKGYSWNVQNKKWEAYIKINGKAVHKYFKLEADAIAWRAKMVAKHYQF